MPMYDLKCPECKTEALDQYVHSHRDQVNCPNCHKPMSRMVSLPRRDSWPEDGIVLEHIAENPMRFSTRKSLQKYCKERGLSSGALL